MNTREIMQIALDLVGFKEIPGDSAIYVHGENIKKVMIGIDIETSELLLGKQLRVDAVIAHHPAGGSAIARYHEVLWKHKDLLIKYGVPEEAALKAVEPLVNRFIVEYHKKNHDHVPSAARLLKMPFLNIHNPLDELGRRIIEKKINDRVNENSTLGDIKDALMELDEFKNAVTDIEIRMGKPGNKAGKIAVAHGAGTNGGYNIAKCYFDHGINTVIYIHIDPAELLRLKEVSNANLIISGHISSDAVGINPFIYELEKRGIEVVRMSGM